jgi:hypothetical protein
MLIIRSIYRINPTLEKQPLHKTDGQRLRSQVLTRGEWFVTSHRFQSAARFLKYAKRITVKSARDHLITSHIHSKASGALPTKY